MNKILISRTDAIGDVVLTLPMCNWLKKHHPDSHIGFIGRTYTESVIKCSPNVDEFFNWDNLRTLDFDTQKQKLAKFDHIIHVFPNKEIAKLAKKVGIKNRIGTTNRIYHWWSCNRLIPLSRKNSPLHESQLNLKLLKPFGYKKDIDTKAMLVEFRRRHSLDDKYIKLIDQNKFNLIIHPKSHGSAVEWGLENYSKLINLLPKAKFKVFITGSNKEKELLAPWIQSLGENIVDVTGLFNLDEFIAFIDHSNGLLACSTGPLHIAASLGKIAIGLYPSIKPIHAERWAPIGPKAYFIESHSNDLSAISTDDVCQFILQHATK